MDSSERPPTLRRGGMVLRAPEEWDVAALLTLLTEPEVARWWGRHDLDSVREEIVRRDQGWVVLVDGAFAGWMEFAEETDPDHRHVGLDISLLTALHGKGHGRAVLRMAIDHFAAQGHHRFTVDPRADNQRAIRCYAAVGFRPVGVMRSYERDADGIWHDGLLMDLLVEEL